MSAEKLDVYVLGGGPRGGKGTMVGDAAEFFYGTATDEAGADYRCATRVLIDEGRLEFGMTPDQVGEVVKRIPVSDIADMVASRNLVVELLGKEILYEEDVNGLVGSVSPHGNVRKAVKEGFKARVRSVRDDSNIRSLLVDGRNLEPVVSGIPGVRLVMSMFVTCNLTEAALRETARQGKTGIDPQIYANLQQRHREDTERELDKVAPQPGALDYWESGIPGTEYQPAPPSRFANTTRFMVGNLAVVTGRQILFDTSHFRTDPDPVAAMLHASRQVLSEAMTSLHPSLIAV